MYCLLEVVSVCPEKLAPKFVDKIEWIKVSVIEMCAYIYKTLIMTQVFFIHLITCVFLFRV